LIKAKFLIVKHPIIQFFNKSLTKELNMKIKNKKAFFLLGAFLLAIVTGRNVFAQNDEKGSSDHPLISRFPGSSIMIYDLKQYNEYLLPLGKVSQDTLEKSQKLVGKVTQITYGVPKDRSVLEIFRNYETFFNSAGFNILFSSKKNELGNGWLGKFLAATPRAYRYGAPALGTRMEGDFNFLVAKMTRIEGDVYVALCVATSWYQDFPVVQLDVVETIPMDIGMMKVNAKTGASDGKSTGSSQEDQSILKSTEVKSFEIKIGVGAYSFSDPMLAGSANNFRYNPTGVVTGSASGYRLLLSPYLNIRYFFNENFGISLDINHMSNNPDIYTTDKQYKGNANLFAQKLGLTGQIVGRSTPVRLSSTMGAGNCITELYQQIINIPSTGSDIYLHGKANMVVLFFNVDVSFPLYKKLFLFGDYEYNLIPVGTFVMEHDGGNDYSDTYYGINFGGSQFRLGLGYSF